MSHPTAPAPSRPLSPAAGVTSWLREPIFPCELIPAGVPGLLAIATDRVARAYLVSVHETGWRVAREDGQQFYNLPFGLSSCDCADSTFAEDRPGGCKHRQALRTALAELFACDVPPDSAMAYNALAPARKGGAA